MIGVVLADDDFLVREILNDSINWDELGMKVLASAADGQEAFDYCVSLRPDILLADIRMPGMNGLETAARLLELNANIHFIFVSGIQDFDYARSALNVQAAAYILKPIRLHEVTAALKKVKDGIAMEQNREEVLLRIQEKLAENIVLLRDLALRNLVLGIQDSDENLDEKMEYLGMSFHNGEDIVVAEIEIDNYRELIKNQGEEHIHILNFTIKGIIDRVLENYQAGSCFMLREGIFIMVLNSKYSERHKMSLIFENILEILRGYNGLSASIGVGNCVTSFRAVNTSYHEAGNALRNKFFTGPGTIIHFGDVAETGAVNINTAVEGDIRLTRPRNALIEQIRLGNETSLAETLNIFYSFTAESKTLSQDYIRGQFLELVITVYQEFCKTEGEAPEIFESYVKAMREVLEAETVGEIKSSAGSFLVVAARYFNDKYSKKHRGSVVRIKDYITKMRNHNISLADIAKEAAYMSVNYMCAVFKRETGQTLNEYIIVDKMNCARDLLKNPKLKIFEIAEQLGYESPHYFSYSFKRYTGLSPQQFRADSEN